MQSSRIEWTELTWNPTTGCNKVSAGCKYCYAEIMHRRLMKMYPDKYNNPFLDGAFEFPEALQYPLKKKKPSIVFVNSMSDIFHENISWNYIYKIFEVMHLAHWHTFQVLTKRAERLPELKDVYMHLKRNYPDADFPSKNVWLGVSVEDQKAADERIPLLLQVPAAIRFLSCEPLLGAVDFASDCINKQLSKTGVNTENSTGIDWVICGGESGNKSRLMHPDWARSLRDQCNAAGVPFFFKQWGEYMPIDAARLYRNDKRIDFTDGVAMLKVGKKKAGRLLDGREWNEMPKITKN